MPSSAPVPSASVIQAPSHSGPNPPATLTQASAPAAANAVTVPSPSSGSSVAGPTRSAPLCSPASISSTPWLCAASWLKIVPGAANLATLQVQPP